MGTFCGCPEGGDVAKLNKARDMQDAVEQASSEAGRDIPHTPAQPQPEEEAGPGQPSEGQNLLHNKSEDNAAEAIKSDEEDAKEKIETP